jgi:2'-5' RNA ligase
MQQLDLMGFAKPDTTPRYRLFFALWPDAATRDAIDAVARRLDAEHAPKGRGIRPHRYHLTLQFLGEFPEVPPHLLQAIERAANRVQTQAFDLDLDRAGSFPIRSAPCWLGCNRMPDGLRRLWEALGEALAREAVRVRSGKTLTPHVTVIRDAHHLWPALDVTPPVHWKIDAFTLLRSDIQQQHAYTELGTWSLKP